MYDDWVPVKFFPGYSVNPLGQVRKDSNNHILKPRYNQYNVAYVGLMRDWQQCVRSLPLLVARHFLPRENEIFDTPIQLDGDPSNCRVDNLMWRPHDYAIKYKRQFKEPYDNPINEPIRAISKDKRIPDEIFPNSFAVACRYGLLEREVVLCIINRTPSWLTFQDFELADMA